MSSSPSRQSSEEHRGTPALDRPNSGRGKSARSADFSPESTTAESTTADHDRAAYQRGCNYRKALPLSSGPARFAWEDRRPTEIRRMVVGEFVSIFADYAWQPATLRAFAPMKRKSQAWYVCKDDDGRLHYMTWDMVISDS
jgi:hypothetical protein